MTLGKDAHFTISRYSATTTRLANRRGPITAGSPPPAVRTDEVRWSKRQQPRLAPPAATNRPGNGGTEGRLFIRFLRDQGTLPRSAPRRRWQSNDRSLGSAAGRVSIAASLTPRLIFGSARSSICSMHWGRTPRRAPPWLKDFMSILLTTLCRAQLSLEAARLKPDTAPLTNVPLITSERCCSSRLCFRSVLRICERSFKWEVISGA